jgi:hypothetical protein
MTRKEYAAKKGITTDRLRAEELAFLESEGYDEAGQEYDTLDAWIDRKPIREHYEPYDGGRGIGQYGRDDI